MPGSPASPLLAAVYTRLNSDATLTTTIGASVYDDVPIAAEPPYVTIGETTEVPRDTMGRTGRDMTLTVHVWSDYAGMKEVGDVQDRVDDLLDRWTPTVTGWAATEMLQEYFESFRDTADPDRPLRHGVARYRIFIQASA